jgi:glyceraldehyde-3-phosphate dehydrogenase/erythrose-4-phosphate dehydrogenase
MTEVFEMLDDLLELQTLYAMNDLTEIDFKAKIQKYQSQIDMFEKNMEHEFEASYAGC